MIKFDGSALRRVILLKTESIGQALGESGLREVGSTGAKIFREEAKVNAASHRKTSVLFNNIIVKRLEEDSDGAHRQSYIVTVRAGKFGNDGDAFYWRFVEKGHKFVRRKKAGESQKMARLASELEYGTSSAPAYPFLRPAYDTKHDESITKMRQMVLELASQAAKGK